MPSFFSSTARAKKSLKSLAMGSKMSPKNEDISPLDCIFACSVCGDVFSDVYQHHDTVHGLSDGINPKERIVTRLYVTSCCHVICIKHIEGGNGPVFHQAGQQPQASCPVCVKESGDDTARQLFSVRGFGKDDHDPAIPRYWFKAPPMTLEGKDKEMEALRFQYLALIRFSKNIATSHKQTARERADIEAKLRSMQDLAAKEQEKAKAFEQELERLRPLEGEARRLHRLEAKLPAVRHYLNLIPKLVEQNKAMQQRLASLGFAMSLEPMPNFNEPLTIDAIGGPGGSSTDELSKDSRNTGSSHTVGRSAQNTGFGEEMEEDLSISAQRERPLKRSRIDSSPTRAYNIHAAPSSRDMMPPPIKPLSKMKSMRKILPNLRNKLTNGRSSGVLAHKPSSDADVQMYDNGQWEIIDDSPKLSGLEERPPTRHGLHSDTPYMTGALPVEDCPVDSRAQPRFLSGLGIHNNMSDFTFESPSILNMPDQRLNRGKLPTDPSYIRLLDGLGQHTGLDLGLEDPRGRNQEPNALNYSPQHITHRLRPGNVPRQKLRSNPPRIQTHNHQKQWNFGHAFLQQSPINANPTLPYHQSSIDRNDDGMVNNLQTRTIVDPITPAPVRSKRPTDEVDHVVSPFFGSSSHRSQPFSRSQFTEPDISSSRSATYQSRRGKPSMDMDWRETRNLNGLSFFNSPVNERNERINWRRETRPQDYTLPLPQHRARIINSEGLLVRPDTEHLPGGHNRTYECIGQSSPQSMQDQQHSAISLPSFSRSSQSQITRLPSAMPSMIPGSSPRRRLQAKNTGLSGVRSNHDPRAHISTGALASSVRPIYPSARRRVIRR